MDGLKPPPCKIWDAHIHVWDAKAFSDYEKWANVYGVEPEFDTARCNKLL